MIKHEHNSRLFGMMALLAACFLLVSCGAESSADADFVMESAEILSTEGVSALPAAQPVEYGASLDEWSDAVEEAPLVVGQLEVEPTAEPAAAAATGEPAAMADALVSSISGSYREIEWDALIPSDFMPDAIMAKYSDQLAALPDGSPDATEIYNQMQEEFNNAPINETLDGASIKLPGFIAPLTYEDDVITEFLLVPYFGACIHSPAPPANQTILVKTAPGQGINITDSYNPIWILGTITAESVTTELAQSGYRVDGAVVEPYKR